VSGWNLPTLLDTLHTQVESELSAARQAIGHPTEKGDASEETWIALLNKHLPRRYEARKAHIVDSKGQFSEQIDVVVHDRQYSPLVFTFKDSHIVPAESVYAVFEAKQELTADYVAYAQKKAASVRNLYRTSLPVPTVDGTKPGKEPGWIIGGILTLTCTWQPPLDATLRGHLDKDIGQGRLDLGCVADAGLFTFDAKAGYSLQPASKSATRFLFELIAQLQAMATVPMIDIREYAKHIP
jgi:hypothetical protein